MHQEGSPFRDTPAPSPKPGEHHRTRSFHRRRNHRSNHKCSTSSSHTNHLDPSLESSFSASSSSFFPAVNPKVDDCKAKCSLNDSEDKQKINCSEEKLKIDDREELKIQSEENLKADYKGKLKVNCEENNSIYTSSAEDAQYSISGRRQGSDRVGVDVIRQSLDSLHIADSAADDNLSELQQEANNQEQQDEASPYMYSCKCILTSVYIRWIASNMYLYII